MSLATFEDSPYESKVYEIDKPCGVFSFQNGDVNFTSKK